MRTSAAGDRRAEGHRRPGENCPRNVQDESGGEKRTTFRNHRRPQERKVQEVSLSDVQISLLDFD